MGEVKLSAFIPVSQSILDLGPEWLDRYVRTILSEAIFEGLEGGIIKGTGKDEPIVRKQYDAKYHKGKERKHDTECLLR